MKKGTSESDVSQQRFWKCNGSHGSRRRRRHELVAWDSETELNSSSRHRILAILSLLFETDE